MICKDCGQEVDKINKNKGICLRCVTRMTNAIHRGKEYVPLLEEICEIKGIEFLDIYNTIGINKNNYNMYLYDGTHANAEGNKLIVKCWLEHLLRKE